MYFNEIDIGQVFKVDEDYQDHIFVKLNNNSTKNSICIREGVVSGQKQGTFADCTLIDNSFELVDTKFFKPRMEI